MSQLSEWLLANHPRVSYVKKAAQCVEHKGGAPGKYFWKRDGTRQDDPAILEKWRCKIPAHWKFKALKKSHAISGTMCFHHLYYRAVFGDTDETTATEKLMVSTGYAKPEETLTQVSH